MNAALLLTVVLGFARVAVGLAGVLAFAAAASLVLIVGLFALLALACVSGW